MNILFCERINRGKHIYRTEGLKALLRQALNFLVNLVFKYRPPYKKIYIKQYNLKMDSLCETDFLPNIQDFTLKIISTNEEADELFINGFEDFRTNAHIRRARERLDKGAVAFCTFIGREFANITWCAKTEEAMNALTEIPFQVNFSNREAFVDNVFTVPKYRKKGLNKYNWYKLYEFLSQEGFTAARFLSPILNWRNEPFDTVIYGKGRFIKLLWWKHWKETSIAISNQGNSSL